MSSAKTMSLIPIMFPLKSLPKLEIDGQVVDIWISDTREEVVDKIMRAKAIDNFMNPSKNVIIKYIKLFSFPEEG